jgi:acyl-CoA thioesterase-1
MGIRARVNRRKELAQWLTAEIHQRDGCGKFLDQVIRFVIILPASVLFCLTLLGCDTQEDTSVSHLESQGLNSQAAPIRETGSSSLGQKDAKGLGNLPRIVAFGDSLTAGLGVGHEDAYPGQLARWLDDQGFQYEVINAGVSGDTTAGGLRRVEWVLKSQPKLVILELGANDGLRGQPLKETYKNLNAIIEGLKANGVIVVLAGMRLPLNYGSDYTQEFSDLFVRLAQEHKISFIPFFLEGVATHRHLNQGDGLHPTAEGYSIVVQNVWRVLQPILKELAHEGQDTRLPLFPLEREAIAIFAEVVVS